MRVLASLCHCSAVARDDAGERLIFMEIPTFDKPEKYEQYAINVEGHAPEKAQEARRRAVKLRAIQDGAKTDVERECLEAIYAYEWTLFKKHGKRQRAAYTWRMVGERGIIPAVEHAVTRSKETAGFRGLEAEGMLDMAFENVVLKHKDMFSAVAVKRSEERLARWHAGDKC
jgi:hypothetical protein